jgi:hypothetical protein
MRARSNSLAIRCKPILLIPGEILDDPHPRDVLNAAELHFGLVQQLLDKRLVGLQPRRGIDWPWV